MSDIKKTLILTYIGRDDWDRPMYRVGDTDTYVKDIELGKAECPSLYWSYPKTDFYGEPDYPFTVADGTKLIIENTSLSKEVSIEDKIFYTKKPKLTVDVISPSGNIYVVMANAARLLKESYTNDQTDRIIEMRSRATASGNDYYMALDIIGEYVDLEVIK